MNRLKKQIIVEPTEDITTVNDVSSKETVEYTPIEDEFIDEISFYLENYKKLDDQFTYEDVISVLPTKDSYNYEDIINRLIAESYKEIKEINELIAADETITKEELIECKALIEKEKKKIAYISK